jgi:alpha-galactosidase
MKVDYNVVIPCGSDSDDGAVPAEVMRRHTEAVCAYFEHIRNELPELVIESCASGGHRISPWWVRFADMVSGSDAHEGWEIPIISAHQSLLIPARALQVWAAVRADDSSDRLHYSLAAGCLGRLVLSGNPDLLDEKQFAIVQEALAFYRKIVPVLQGGKVSIPCTVSGRWNNPAGYQVVRREKGNLELVVFHTFADSPEEIILSENGRVVSSFLPEGVECADNGSIVCKNLRPFTGGAVLLER